MGCIEMRTKDILYVSHRLINRNMGCIEISEQPPTQSRYRR